MRACLVALNEGPDIPLGRDPLMVGRHPDCDVRLPSIRVSRRHCCMTEVDGEVSVRDLGSTNGTLINGRRVESGRLRRGDLLSIADLSYRLEVRRVARTSLDQGAEKSREERGSRAEPPGTALYD